MSNGSIPSTSQWPVPTGATVYGWIGGWAMNWLPSVSAHSGKQRGDSTSPLPTLSSAAFVPCSATHLPPDSTQSRMVPCAAVDGRTSQV